MKKVLYLVITVLMIMPNMNVNATTKEGLASDVIINNLNGGSTFDDGYDTFITGEDPNNYIWYSGKLWRAVSVNNSTRTVKLVTEWNISTISYNENSTYKNSYMEKWLNDTTVDGFLYNLKDYNKYIVPNANWNANLDDTSFGMISRPTGTTITNPVGLLNIYEYQSSTDDILTYKSDYLNNGLYWRTLTPFHADLVRNVNETGSVYDYDRSRAINGVRPAIVLKENIKIVDGTGIATDPYRLEGDNDKNLIGTKLNTRYSGEYIRFGKGENNLYRIVSHETPSLTKIVSAEPLKENGKFKTIKFGDTTYSESTTIGLFLNGEYLNSGSYLTDENINLIEDNTTWYLGNIDKSGNYKLAKYENALDNTLTPNKTTAKVGLLRYGELMAGQFNSYDANDKTANTDYWLLTPHNTSNASVIKDNGTTDNVLLAQSNGIRPSLNLKENVLITGGSGTIDDPFTISDKITAPTPPDDNNSGDNTNEIENNPDTSDNFILYMCLSTFSIFAIVLLTLKIKKRNRLNLR